MDTPKIAYYVSKMRGTPSVEGCYHWEGLSFDNRQLLELDKQPHHIRGDLGDVSRVLHLHAQKNKLSLDDIAIIPYPRPVVGERGIIRRYASSPPPAEKIFTLFEPLSTAEQKRLTEALNRYSPPDEDK